ncbi:MAG TPA: T9SS type A sorting domain-containing protein [Sunxiuqinia sp.]|nr:T9SS type A sorting domain-containing protein [Sunxiuqinia sp.]
MKNVPMLRGIFIFLLIFTSTFAYSSTYYIAVDGDDANSGTIESPLASIHKAQELVVPGDTVFIRGGTYKLTDDDISNVYQNLFACISFLDKSGTALKMINYWNYPGETPVFDFSAVKPADQRVVGIYVRGSYLHFRGLEMTGIQVTITTHTESYCIYSRGSHNIYERMSFHDNKGTGLRHYGGGYNLFVYCDSYRNHDDVSENKKGGNTDGFGCHPSKGGVGNVFLGCRSWFNSDDGYDCIRAQEPIVFDHCESFYNGYSTSFQSLADGNGFKAGGFAHDAAADIPDPVPSHTVRFCLAVRNKANGFYSNHHLTGDKWYNNTAYANAVNFNMVNRESPELDNLWVNGYDHVLINNLSFKGRSSETAYIDTAQNTLKTNSWDSDVIVSSADFASLDEKLLVEPRRADGSLPKTDFMRLTSYSDLIDKGTDIGFPFEGAAPDLGAFEYHIPTGIGSLKTKKRSFSMYPNPTTDVLYLNIDHLNKVKILDLAGKSYLAHFSQNQVNVSSLPRGTYVLMVYADNQYMGANRFVKL